MKKYFLFALGGLLAATISFAQTSTEYFNTETAGSKSFTDNGVVFNISSRNATFDIGNYSNAGWNSNTIDTWLIDNTGTALIANAEASFSIKTTSNLFKVGRFWVFVANHNFNQAATGTLTVTGKLSGVTKFSQTKDAGFATSLGTNNGYTLINMSSFNGQNYSNMVVDELELTLGGDYRYLGFDAFEWTKDAGMVLPVTFGSVNAAIKNDRLSANWTTEEETANDHFEIEASTDGQQFTKIATVASKAINGNSDVALNYDWTSGNGLPLAAWSLLSITLLPFSNLGRRKTWMLVLSVLAIMTFTIAGCSKSGDAISNNQSYYIRVAQVDKDGSKSYSKIVRVQQDQ